MVEDSSNIIIHKQEPDEGWKLVTEQEKEACINAIKMVPPPRGKFISVPITDTTAIWIFSNNTYRLIDLISNKVNKLQITILPRYKSAETLDDIITGLEYYEITDRRSLISGLKAMNSVGYCHNQRGCGAPDCIVKARQSIIPLEDKLFIESGIPKRLNCTNKYTSAQLKAIKHHMIQGNLPSISSPPIRHELREPVLEIPVTEELTCNPETGCSNPRCIVKARQMSEEWIQMEDSIFQANGLEPRIICDIELTTEQRELIEACMIDVEHRDSEDNPYIPNDDEFDCELGEVGYVGRL